MAVNGNRDVLGLHLGEHEGAHQWGRILEDIQKRVVEDVLFFCVDGLTGFSLKMFPDRESTSVQSFSSLVIEQYILLIRYLSPKNPLLYLNFVSILHSPYSQT
ncbi:MAG: transposase [Saprospiraceae bacterium]|nr:transposase [Saprospiraceae bacterium]MBK7605898.1 transposase [Saprospiraceae bacterium]MBP7802471.1 transposase [Saprospiraceae bacterium]MBP8096224.1 transposase [Saprospiraceae bacterium]